MYRIKLQSGEESEFSSFEELCFGIVSGIIGPDDEIYHARASKWLPIQSHPDYKRAAAQAPPPSPALASSSSANPPGVVGSHESPEEEDGLDLMTLLDLEELTAFDPGKVQESALPEEGEPEVETAELEPIEAKEPDALETNGHAAPSHPVEIDDPAADTDDATVLETEESPAETDAADKTDEEQIVERSSDDEEPARAELDINKSMEPDVDEEAPAAEMPLPDDELVAELDHDSDADGDREEEVESELDEVPGVTADAADGSGDIDHVAEEDQDDVPMMEASATDLDTPEDSEVDDDEFDAADLDAPDAGHAVGTHDIDYVAAEDEGDVPMMEASAPDRDTAEDLEGDDDELDVADLDVPASDYAEGTKDIDYVAAEDIEDVPMMESAVATADVIEDEEVEEIEAGEHTDEAADQPSMDQETDSKDDAAEDEEPVIESVTPATLEVEGEVFEEASDLEDGDTEEDAESEAEPVAQADDAADDEDPLLGGTVVEIDHSEDELSTPEADELESEEALVVTAEVADPIDECQLAVDEDPFRDTFRPTPELVAPRRLPVLPVAVAAGVVVMAALGWIVMGSGGSDEPVTVPEAPTPTPAVVPAANSDLNQQSLAAEDPSEDVQRRYDEAYDGARSRLSADFRSAGFAAVFAPGNFATEESMVTARAAIAGASLAVTAYAGREQAIREGFPDADPTGRESRAHRELTEDLLAVSQRIYGLLLSNKEAYALRNGALTITDPAVESEYTRLRGEVNRLMALAATADEEQAATVRRVVSAIGASRPPALVELAPPPALPTDL